MTSGMHEFVCVGRALVEARVGIESQKARGPRSIVVRVAVTNGVCGRVVMWVLREPFEAVNGVCAPGLEWSVLSSGRIGWQGRHELVKSVRTSGSGMPDQVAIECGKVQWRLMRV